MPGDFRWHAFTVMAVILAFGLGVLAGVALPHERLLVDRQQALIQRLEREFENLREDNRRWAQWAAEQEARDQAALESTARLSQLAVAGRLANRTVWLLTRGAVPEATAAAVGAALQAAGARAVQGRVDDLAGPSGLAESVPDGVVVLDAGTAEPIAPLIAEIRRMAGAATPVVVATPSPQRAAEARAQEPPVTVVDHAAEPVGQVALILGLLGVEGYYGAGPGADGPLPPTSAAVPVLGEQP